ncbi:MAG: cryptochrome/photolyase family protein [Quisquiliibacterium sp.]
MTAIPVRHLVLVLGDQLDLESSAFDGFDATCDAVWMAEVREESTHVPSHKARIALFLSAMRHFAESLRERGWSLHYRRLDDDDNAGSLAAELAHSIVRLRPERLIMSAPGDWRVLQSLRQLASTHQLELEIRDDRHFLTTIRDFSAHAAGRKQLRQEYFYRELRRRFDILMDNGKPVGGQWNYDQENRSAFPAEGPRDVPAPCRFEPDAITCEVIALVEREFSDHPGSLTSFAWPTTRAQALQCLEDFITNRLPGFGRYQDAMWQGQAWLYHSHLSCALNLKLIRPLEVVDAAQRAWSDGKASLASTEGFIRQVIGWREYVRGIYWTQMPGYLERNALNARAGLPAVYWHGKTSMACLADAVNSTLEHGYAHHIQRLMVTGLYALLYGVDPHEIHAWYLAMYVDAVEWVELPNTLGMSQYADGGLMASKPYVASGKYIARMSNYCKACPYDPAMSVGAKACPMTTLYWDFLIRHEVTLGDNPRLAMQLRNLTRLDENSRSAIRELASLTREAASSATP